MREESPSAAGPLRSRAGVAGLGTILGVWAHPDDEAYLSAGLMAIARESGSRVVCVTATRGELGTAEPSRWPPQRLAAQRTEELGRCLEILGVQEHHWLGYRDGECAQVHEPDAVAQLSELIERVVPDAVLTFGPDGITGHPDHQAVCGWTTAAFAAASAPGSRLFYAAVAERRVLRWRALDASLGVYLSGYPVPTGDDQLAIDLTLDDEVVTRKVSALRAQETQTLGLIDTLGLETYTAWVRDESFVQRRRQPPG